MVQAVCLLPFTQEPWLAPGRFSMGFVVNKVALEHVFLLVFLFLPYENHSTVALLTHIQCHLGDDTTGRWRPQFRDPHTTSTEQEQQQNNYLFVWTGLH